MKLKRFVPFLISVLMIFQVCILFIFADEDTPEKIPQRIMDLANHKYMINIIYLMDMLDIK
ncbi:hypothetical protein ACTPDI_07460 [Clostridioides difficile]